MTKKIIIGLLLVLLACYGIYAGFNGNNIEKTTSIDKAQIDVENLEKMENIAVNEKQNIEKKLFNTDQADTNTILVENNSTLEIKDSIVNKTGDSSSNGDNVDFYGSNSAILVKKGSMANIENIEINTNSTGSNAIFVTNGESEGNDNYPNSKPMEKNSGNAPEMNDEEKPPEIPAENGEEKAKDMSGENMTPNQENSNTLPGQTNEDYSTGGANATVSKVIINTYKDKSRGVDATYGGKISIDNSIINTRGISCAALATDRGEGTVVANHCELNTGVDNGTGRGSPCIYSTGNISVSDSTGTSYVSQIACIEGKNSINLDNCNLTCFAGGNREENGKFVDLGGIFIYQSMSGDADVGTATLNATDSILSISKDSEHYTTAPMFHITNTKAIMNLKNCEMEFGSNTLVNISGQNQWGTAGSNGGDLEFNSIENDNLTGNILVDEISSLNLNLKYTKYVGSINSQDNYGNVTVTLDSESTWTLTGDCHITNLENNGNIEYGNYTLYVNGEAYTQSNPYK